ncbi:MAG: 30S ribosome-binding factor RbfA [Desulfobacterota bacterium]|nr:30S ribosome-binding factor RbfA [Thermodesulfobacteriota bacterium]
MRSGYSRVDRVSDSIKKEVADILNRHVKDPRLAFMTITYVRVARDLRHARIYFTSMREDADLEAVFEGLRRATGFVQRKLGERLHLRYTPHLSFTYDTSVARGLRMTRLLAEIEHEIDEIDEINGDDSPTVP